MKLSMLIIRYKLILRTSPKNSKFEKGENAYKIILKIF